MTELAGLEKHLAYVGDLEVVAKLTDHAGSVRNGMARREELRRGEHVGEGEGVWVGPRSNGVFGEGFNHCAGSIVITNERVMMTHNYPYGQDSQGTTNGYIDIISGTAQTVRNGVSVVWRRNFEGTKDGKMQATTDAWCDTLIGLYQSLGIVGVLMTFGHDQNNMSAYYNGDRRIILTANWMQKKILFEPLMSHF